MFTEDKIKYYTDNKRLVVATCKWMGMNIRAEATCHPNDIFDYQIGKELVTARLYVQAKLMQRQALTAEVECIDAELSALNKFRAMLTDKLDSVESELSHGAKEINRLIGR